MDMIKVAVIGTIGSLLALALKSAKGEFATYINLSACVLIMLYLAARLSGIVSQLEFMTEYVDIDSDYNISYPGHELEDANTGTSILKLPDCSEAFRNGW